MSTGIDVSASTALRAPVQASKCPNAGHLTDRGRAAGRQETSSFLDMARMSIGATK